MFIRADKSQPAYYNEHDPSAAAWLRELMYAGLITNGEVDERSIEDVLPSDLAGFDRHHFFAGVAVWDFALNQAGWGARPVWTGSCPCQPFSSAGKGVGFTDERHLWPAFHHLIEQCKPDVVFGEQVASKDGLAWIDLVLADLEGTGYAAGAVDTCSAGFGAPHIRQRLYWLADSSSERVREQHGSGAGAETAVQGEAWERERGRVDGCSSGTIDRMADSQMRGQSGGLRECGSTERAEGSVGRHCAAGGMGDNNNPRLQGHGQHGQLNATEGRQDAPRHCAEAGAFSGVANTQSIGRGICDSENVGTTDAQGDIPTNAGNMQFVGQQQPAACRPSPTNGHWRDVDWLFCRDGKWRPVEPGTFPLVDAPAKGMVRGSNSSVPFDAGKTGEARVMRLRGYGNAVNAAAAQAFIEVYCDSMNK